MSEKDQKDMPMKDGLDGFDESHKKAGYKSLGSAFDDDDKDGDEGRGGEYEYKPGATKNDSNVKGSDSAADAYKSKKGRG